MGWMDAGFCHNASVRPSRFSNTENIIIVEGSKYRLLSMLPFALYSESMTFKGLS